MNPETLLTSIPTQPSTHTIHSKTGNLNEQKINRLIEDRQQLLESLKNKVSLKFFFSLEEKLQTEKKQLQTLLEWQTGKQTIRNRYTLPLDSQFFEQLFLN